MTELQERIIAAAIEEFSVNGLRFTMDDLAKRLHISKKTLYAVYPGKEALMLAVADASFRDIRECKRIAAEEGTDDLLDKLRRVLGALPDRYRGIGLNRLCELKEKYPAVYARVQKHLNSDWEGTLSILQQAQEEGSARPISVPIFKTMYESTLEAFMRQDVLVENGITYVDAMQQTIDILLHGISAR